MTSLFLLMAPSSKAEESSRIQLATNPLPPSSAKPAYAGDPMRELKGIEHRFFFHEYDHDPLPKRLERIELLVFGGVQDGDNVSRLAKLKAALALRDREAAQKLSEKNKTLSPTPPPGPGRTKTTAPASGAQYPILQTLEWKALKKTYGSESLDQRLERLETTLLGQATTAMSYADRIERLCKIIGIDSSYSPPATARAMPRGPLPKAGGRSISPYFNSIPRDLGDDDSFSFDEDLRERATIDLREMMQMMQQMQRSMPPGFGVPPGFALPRGARPIPDGGSMSPFAPSAEPKKPKIPPYADPNSI